MLPLVLVLVAATSAYAAPYVSVGLTPINDVIPQQINGINSILTERFFETNDGADKPIYTLYSQEIINDLANAGDSASKALSLGQALAALSEYATGVAGDACTTAGVIDSYVAAARSGNKKAINNVVANYIQNLNSNIDRIVQLLANPKASRFASGPRGNCANGGRIYDFEGAWDLILANVPANSASLINEAYCEAKRLYNAFTDRSNNVGARITAVSLPQVNQVIQRALNPVANFIAAVANGNVASAAIAANSAKAALRNSVY